MPIHSVWGAGGIKIWFDILKVAGGVVIGITVNTIRVLQLLWYLGVIFFALL